MQSLGPGGARLPGPRLGQSQAARAFVPPSADGRPHLTPQPASAPRCPLPSASAVGGRRPEPPVASGSARVGRGCRWTTAGSPPRCPRLRPGGPASRPGVGFRRAGLSGTGAENRSRAPREPPSQREPRRRRGVAVWEARASAPPRPAPRRPPLSTTTSDQTRRPAEFKHITKRRKRN